MILVAVLREIRNLKEPNPSKVKSFMYVLPMRGRCPVKLVVMHASVYICYRKQ